MNSIFMTIEAAAQAMGGAIIYRGSEKSFVGVSTDSRKIKAGQAFIAIKGPNFDGHDYQAVAAQAGAAVIIASRPLAEVPRSSTTLIQVSDTRQALGSLARSWRHQVQPRVVAITGSVGKTTTKELTRNILAQVGSIHSTVGNFNNDIGLPLTLMDMPKTTQYLVAEMGMSGAGEIAYLTNLTEPDVGLITALAPVHLEQMGSLEAIAAAKGELLQGLKADGIAVIPSQEPRLLPFIQHLPKSQCLFFGTRSHDDVRLLSVKSRGIDGSLVELSVQGELIEFYLPLVGEHNARNAAAAAAAALALNIPPSRIKEGLSQPPQLSHRSSVRKLGPFHILDDCYNASPLAVKAALKAVVELADHNGCSAPAVAVLGSMLELGVQAEFYHQEVGAYAATLPLSRLITVGPLAAHIARGAIQAEMKPDRVHVVDTISEAAMIISAQVPADAWILVKASRGARLEELFEKLSALEQS